MKLLLLTSSLAGGGAERVMLRLAEHWRDAGHDVHLATIASKARDFYPMPADVSRHALGLEAEATGPVAALRANRRRVGVLRELVRRVRPDAVLSFLSETNVLALLAIAPLGVPVMVSERVDPRRHAPRPPWGLLRRLTYARASALVVQTERVAEWGRRLVGTRRVHVIPNAVEAPATGGSPAWLPAAPFVLGIGRLTPQKGFDVLVRGFSRFAVDHPTWRLVILGEGDERSGLERLATDLGVADRMILPGIVASPGSVLASSRCFVLSSRYEGFPNALLEALSAGVPCVSTDCDSGPREVLADGRAGLLVPVDDPSALADAMARIADDPSLASRLVGFGRAEAARYAPARVFAQWDRLLDVVVGGARRATPVD